jgi:hypothetical protein
MLNHFYLKSIALPGRIHPTSNKLRFYFKAATTGAGNTAFGKSALKSNTTVWQNSLLSPALKHTKGNAGYTQLNPHHLLWEYSIGDQALRD